MHFSFPQTQPAGDTEHSEPLSDSNGNYDTEE